jgi:hypothetical protein
MEEMLPLLPAGVAYQVTDLIELPFTDGYMIGAGVPDVQQAYEKLLKPGREALK